MNNWIYRLIFLPVFCFCQPGLQAQTLFTEGTIYDENTGQPLPYASIYNIHNKAGTVTNMQGYFRLEITGASDTLRISNIGYTTRYLPVHVEQGPKTRILLKPRTSTLPEIKVVAEESYLYSLVASIKNKKNNRQAKAYFQLETFLNEDQAELVQGYYNGEFSGYYAEGLHLKNGRLALKRMNQHVFVSTEMSRAITMYQFFEKDEYFPVNPLQLSRSKMIPAYSLQLVNRYREENGTLIHVVRFQPKKEDSLYFEGTFWIDSARQNLHKIELNILHTSRHPFAPVTDRENIKNVELHINMGFAETDQGMYVSRIDFRYSFLYQNRQNLLMEVETHAFLSAYDYTTLFDLPYFEFPVTKHTDYRNIAAVPYNAFFWEHNREFSMGDEDGKAWRFFNRLDVINNLQFYHDNDIFNKGIFQHPYIQWSKDRITFSEIQDDSIQQLVKNPTYLSDMYKLKIQLYLDVNIYADTLSVLTSTIFDPFGSYYFLPIEPQNTCFLNIYFDMVEIERQKLEKELRSKKMTVDEVKSLYLQAAQNLLTLGKKYFTEVERGENYEALLTWNHYVNTYLGIDNMALLGIYRK